MFPVFFCVKYNVFKFHTRRVTFEQITPYEKLNVFFSFLILYETVCVCVCVCRFGEIP